MAVIYRNETSYCGPISMLQKLDNGDLVLVFREALWQGAVSHADPTTRTSLIRSTDSGETWHSQVTPSPDGGNGTTVNQLSDGTLIISYFKWLFAPPLDVLDIKDRAGFKPNKTLGILVANGGVHVTRSFDRGYTWEYAREMFDSIDASSAGKIVELDDGMLLIPMNEEDPTRSKRGSWVARSMDRGDSWEFLSFVAENRGDLAFAEMRLLLMPSGRILASMRSQEAFYSSYSDDGGMSWAPIADTGILCRSSSPFDMLLLDDGRVLASYAERREEPIGVRACLSEDGGMTWDMANEVVLRDDAIDWDMGYPSSQQLDDGSILTVYYWHDDDEIRHLQSSRWRLE